MFSDGIDVILVAGAATPILATDVLRRVAIITNLAANVSTIRVGNITVNANRGIPLAPGETVSLETTYHISGWNPGLVNQNVAVCWTSD